MNTSAVNFEHGLKRARNAVCSIEKYSSSPNAPIIDVIVAKIAKNLKKLFEVMLLCATWLIEKQIGIDIHDVVFIVDSMRWSIMGKVHAINDLLDMSLPRMVGMNVDFTTLDFEKIACLASFDFKLAEFERDIRFNIDSSTRPSENYDGFRLK